MNLNMKLTLDGNIGASFKKLLRHAHVILVAFFCAVLAYSVYFAVNLFYAKEDLDVVSNQQATSERSKQIRFNEKTLKSLDQLLPRQDRKDVPIGGRNDPFAP